MPDKANVAGGRGIKLKIVLAASILWIAFDFIFGPSSILIELLIYNRFSHFDGIFGLGHLPTAVFRVLLFAAPAIDAALIAMLFVWSLKRSTAGTRTASWISSLPFAVILLGCALVDGSIVAFNIFTLARGLSW